jgi:hypothetical protein
MEQETVANPEPVAEEVTQAPEAEQPTDDNAPGELTIDEQNRQDQIDAPAVDDDSEEVEWEGKTFKAPKGVKDGILRQSDYTKKTMELAERQKAWTSSIEANRAFTADVGKLMTMDEQLQQYEQVDWNAWHASNPEAARSAHFNMQTLRDKRDSLARDVNARAQEQEANAAREYETRISQDLAILSKPDPKTGWDGKFTPERKTALENFGRSLGYPDEALARANANDVKTLHAAMLWMEHLNKQRALAKQPLGEAKPVPNVGAGRGNIVSNPADMDMERYVQWRAKGGGARR